MTRASSRFLPLAVAVLALSALPRASRAQDDDALRKKFLIAVPSPEMTSVLQPGNLFRGAPGTNTGTPMAFAPGWRDAFAGAGYQGATRGVYNPVTKKTSANGGDDGALSMGFGVGDARESVGLEVDITSLSTFRSGFFNRTAFSFKASHMLDEYSAIAFGVENAFIAGGGKTDGTDSWYGVATRVFLLPQNSSGMFKAITASAGIGNGRFRFIQDVASGRSTVNAFGSASLLIIDQLSAIVDYTGQDLDLGVSIVPLKMFPIVLTPALSDVTGTASKTMRFTMGVGMGIHF